MAQEIDPRLPDLLAQIATLKSEKAASLVRRSETIAELQRIVASLDQIVSTMKRLSINASIEAARAGDAGQGFSIVAGEFRSLAGEAQSAVNHASGLLEIRSRDHIVQ